MEKDINIKYQIQKIEEYKDGGKYKVKIRIPMSLGWIDHMNLMP